MAAEIVEAEAYVGYQDKAGHASKRWIARIKVFFGIYDMFNVMTEPVNPAVV